MFARSVFFLSKVSVGLEWLIYLTWSVEVKPEYDKMVSQTTSLTSVLARYKEIPYLWVNKWWLMVCSASVCSPSESTLERGWPRHQPAPSEHDMKKSAWEVATSCQRVFCCCEKNAACPPSVPPASPPPPWDMTCSQEKSAFSSVLPCSSPFSFSSDTL